MYLARSFPLIKPASFHLPTGYVPFDASAPPKRCRVLASVGPSDSEVCSTAKMRRTKSLAPYCHHYHHRDACADQNAANQHQHQQYTTPPATTAVEKNINYEQHLRPQRPLRRTSTMNNISGHNGR